MSDLELAEFGRLFREFLRKAIEAAPDEPSELVQRLAEQLGADPAGLPVVSQSYEVFEHANVHLAIQAYVSSGGRGADIVGIGGGAGREHHSLSELLTGGFGFRWSIGTVDYASVSVGPATDLTVVRFGLFLISDGDIRLAALLRATSEALSRTGRAAVGLEVLCADPAAAQRMLSRIRDLMVTHNVFRGQVVSFEPTEFSQGVGPMRFHARPALGRDDVILPAGTLAEVERQIIGVAEHRERLRAAGHQLKRGVLSRDSAFVTSRWCRDEVVDTRPSRTSKTSRPPGSGPARLVGRRRPGDSGGCGAGQSQQVGWRQLDLQPAAAGRKVDRVEAGG